jgi:quercetin dioxygenase-like cupin family protein
MSGGEKVMGKISIEICAVTPSPACGRGALLAALLLAAPAFAQAPDNPIPNSGGALIMPKETLPDPLAAGWKGEKVCEVLQENALLRSFRCTFPPGFGHERHFHAPHFGYVLTGGKMRITDESGTREVETKDGDSWKSDGVKWHEALNIGDTTAVYIITEPKGPTK